MNKRLILICFILFSVIALGQNKKYKPTTNSELKLYKDLISKEGSSFVISPLIYETIDPKWLDVSILVKRYGFNNGQFKGIRKDTLLINRNKHFNVINPDTLIRFEKLSSKLMINDSTVIFDPYYYFIEKTYHKKCICTFHKIIFSRKKTYAIAEYMIRCGMDDGRGETVLMKKTTYKWIIIKSLVFHGS